MGVRDPSIDGAIDIYVRISARGPVEGGLDPGEGLGERALLHRLAPFAWG